MTSFTLVIQVIQQKYFTNLKWDKVTLFFWLLLFIECVMETFSYWYVQILQIISSFLTFVCICVLNHVLFFCNPMNCSAAGPSVHGILQTRILERAAISENFPDPEIERISPVFPALAGRFFTTKPLGRPFWFLSQS